MNFIINDIINCRLLSYLAVDRFLNPYFFTAVIFILAVIIAVLGSGLFYYYNQRNLFRKRYEKEKDLQFLNKEFKTVLYSIGDGVITTDINGLIRQMNRTAEQLTGWSESDAKGKPVDDIFCVLIDGERGVNTVEKVLKTGRITELAGHTVLVNREGKKIPIADSGAPVKNGEGKIVGVILVFRDKTAEYNTEKLILKNNKRLNRAELVSKSGNWELHPDKGIMFVSQGAAKLIGIKERQINYGDFKNISLPEYLPLLDSTLNGLINKGLPYDIEFRIINDNTGEISDIHSVAEYETDSGVVFGIIQDITDRKKSEKELLESKERNRATLYSIGDAVISTDDSGRIMQMNIVAEELTGYKEHESVGKHLDEIFRIINEKTRAQVESPVNKVLREGKVVGIANHTVLISKDGREIPITDSGAPIKDPNNRITGVVLVFRDQSKERAAQNALLKSETRLRHSQKVARIGHYIFNIKDGTWESSEMLDELFGISECYNKDIEGWLDIIHPEQRNELKEYLSVDILANKHEFNKDYKIVNKKDNKVYWVHGQGSLEFDLNGEPVKMFGTIQDITDRKKYEEILLYQKGLLQQMGKMAKVGGWEFDTETGKGTWTEEVALIHDLNPEDETNMEKGLSFYSGNSRIAIENAIRDAVESGKSYDLQLELFSAKGIHKWVHTIGLPVIENGKVVKVRGSFQDITTGKLSELALRESREKWESLFSFSPNAIAIYRAVEDGNNFIFTDFNNTAAMIDKISRENVLGKKLTEVFPAAKEMGLLKVLQKVWVTGKTEKMKIKFYRDERIHGWRENIVYRLKTGEIVAIYSDVTKRMQAEIALRESEEKFRNIVETANEGIMIADSKQNTTFVNNAFAKMLGYRPSELIGMNIKELIHIDEAVDFNFKINERFKGIHDVFERKYKRKDGTVLIGLVSATALLDNENKFAGSLGMITDITKMKKAEANLLEIEGRFKTVFNASPEAMSISEIETGKLIEVNDAYEKIFGYSREEAVGKTSFEIGIWANDEDRNRYIESLTEKKSKNNIELLFKKKNGSLMHCLISGRYVKFNDREYVLSVVNDITEMKKNEAGLRESEERFRNLFQENYALMFLTDPADGRIVDVNNATVNYYGWDREELLNMKIYQIDMMPHQNLKKILDNASINRQNHFETKHKLADGSVHDMEIFSSSIYVNNKLFRHSIVYDITAKKQAEEKIHLLAHAVENTEEGICILDLNKRLIFVNDAFTNIYGYGRDEILNKHIKILMPEYNADEQYEAVRSATWLHGWSGELISRKKDGTNFPIYLSTSTVADDTNIPYAVVGIFMDITDRVKREKELDNYRYKLEEQIKQRTRELNITNARLTEQLRKQKEIQVILKESLNKEKELNELKTRFISTASHEFRTPLTSVFSSAELIQRYGRKWNEKKLGEHVERIKNSVDYITKLLDEVLTISKVESGKLNFSPVELNLFEFCNEIINEVKPLAGDNHEFVYNYLPAEKNFKLDPNLLRFILVNLLSNALKYSPKGGIIGINIERADSLLIFKIRDEGIGIPEQDKAHLFEPFHRCSNSVDIPGTGLGLSIVYQSVKLHGGEVKVSSQINKGSVFTVKFKITN